MSGKKGTSIAVSVWVPFFRTQYIVCWSPSCRSIDVVADAASGGGGGAAAIDVAAINNVRC